MKGTTLLLSVLTLLEGYLPPRRSLANIEYRLYKDGDVMEGQKLKRCKDDPCYVAVDLGTSEKYSDLVLGQKQAVTVQTPPSFSSAEQLEFGETVIGIVEMTIPSRTLEKSLEKLIRADMPKPTEAGKIGYINYVSILHSTERPNAFFDLVCPCKDGPRVEVLSKWQGQGIGKALTTSAFGY
ncbi:hypothetical protein FOZ61_003880, partial [Perkinsus olseni]